MFGNVSSPGMPPHKFDPWQQTLIFYDSDHQPHRVPMSALENYRLYGASHAIAYGSQLGACVVMLLALLILTKAEKRKSFIFVINTLCLICETIRAILSCCYFTGSAWNVYSQMSGDWSRLSRTDANTAYAADVMTLVVATLITMSLALQVWAVCLNMDRLNRNIIMFVTGTMGLIALGFKFAAVCFSIKQGMAHENIGRYGRLISISYFLQTAAIWLFSLVFTCKLGYALVLRRRLNMTQFGPMQIIFIMGCQTMIIPALFSTLQFYQYKGFPLLGTWVLTVVVILLPLSSIWAGTVSDTQVAGRDPDSVRRLIHGGTYRSSSSTLMDRTSTFTGKSKSTRGSDSIFRRGKGLEMTYHEPLPKSMNHTDPDAILFSHDFGILGGDPGNRV